MSPFEKDRALSASFEVPAPPSLSKDEGDLLVRIALQAIRSRWKADSPGPPVPAAGPLLEKAGAFVSIHCRGDLRGCLGLTRTQEPLWRTVQELAVSASLNDPRFEPVSEDEYLDLTVEVSVLGPLVRMPAIDPEVMPLIVKVGEHGLLIRARGMSGLLLPQVASRYNWSPRRFLEEVCSKAGLPRDTWRKEGSEVFLFRCSIFEGRPREETSGSGGT